MVKLKLALLVSPTKLAQQVYQIFLARYTDFCVNDIKLADIIVCIGGDGFMLESIHEYNYLQKPFYGVNCGTVGFLMNQYNNSLPENLLDKLEKTAKVILNPLTATCENINGEVFSTIAVNEIVLHRQSRQAIHFNLTIDHKQRAKTMIGDGVMVATPAGSTAYNLSAGGVALPITANLLAITPINIFRPRRWRGALISQQSLVSFASYDNEKRPVRLETDQGEICDVIKADIKYDTNTKITILFDADHHLDERIIQEQFCY
jgi:NAD+ kinase